MSSRIVLTSWGSYGDLFPYLALAIRLKALGHDPVLAAPGNYRDMVGSEGVRFHSLSPDVNPSDTRTIERVMDPARGTEVVVRDLLVPSVRQGVEELRDVMKGADLAVSHPVTFAAPIAAESIGIRWLSSVLAPVSLFSAHDFPLLPPHARLVRAARSTRWTARAFLRIAKGVTAPWTKPIRELRAELGLPDRGDPLYEGQFSPHGTVALFSPIFGPPQPDWPPRTTATGFPFHKDSSNLPPELEAFLDAGPAPVVFTLGTSAVGAAGSFYDESVQVAAALERRAVFLVGADARNHPKVSLPPWMIACAYAPHRELFHRAAAVVHHGGIGTTAQALRAGRPMLVVPHAHDQPDNAFRVKKLGVARALDAQAYRAPRATAQLRMLLTDPAYAERAAEVANRLRQEDGVARASEVILAAAEQS